MVHRQMPCPFVSSQSHWIRALMRYRLQPLQHTVENAISLKDGHLVPTCHLHHYSRAGEKVSLDFKTECSTCIPASPMMTYRSFIYHTPTSHKYHTVGPIEAMSRQVSLLFWRLSACLVLLVRHLLFFCIPAIPPFASLLSASFTLWFLFGKCPCGFTSSLDYPLSITTYPPSKNLPSP